MDITKENYESFFLDYYEGQLSSADEQQLRAFLAGHPELQAEFDAFEAISLEDEITAPTFDASFLKKEVVLEDPFEEKCIAYWEGDLSDAEKELFLAEVEQSEAKQAILERYRTVYLAPTANQETIAGSLYKLAPLTLPIHLGNLEDFIIASHEGDLNETLAAAFQAYLKENPSAQEKYLAFAKLVLQADHALVYPDKADLKQPVRKGIVIPMWTYGASIAAMIALLIWWGSEVPEPVYQPQLFTAIDTVKVDDEAPKGQLAAEDDSSIQPKEQSAPQNQFVTPKTIQTPEVNQIANQGEEPIGPTKTPKAPKFDEPKQFAPDKLEDSGIAQQEPKSTGPNEPEKTNPNTTVKDPLQPSIDVDAIAYQEPTQTTTEYLTPKQLMKQKIRTALFGEKKAKKKDKLEGNDYAASVANGLGKVSKKAVDFQDKTDDEYVAYTLSVGSFKFSRKKKKVTP